MVQSHTLFIRLLAIALVLVLGVQHSNAQCGPFINGRFGGEVSGVAYVNGGAILVAQGTEVELYSLSPSAPIPFSPRRKIGIPSPAVKISMSVNSSNAFVLMQDGNVQIIGIGYIPSENLATSATIQLGDAVDIVGDGRYVYIARQVEEPYVMDPYVDSSIEIYTVSNSPAGAPIFLRTIYPLTDDYGFDRLAKVGNVLWAGFHELRSTIFGVDGFNVTSPDAPVRTGTALNNVPFGDFTRVTAMTAAGTNLYVTYRRDDSVSGHEENWLSAVNVATPSSPAWRPGIELNDVATTMSANGTNLRIALVDPASIKSYNISNPSAITLLGSYTNGLMNLRQMYVGTGTDYWAGGPAGLMTMNTLNPAAIVPRSDPFVPVPTAPKVVRQRGNTTIVLDYTLNALRIFDYTLPEGQQLRSSYALPWYSELVEIGDLAGDVILACVASQGNPDGDVIEIIDITNNTAPVHRSTITGFTPHLLSVAGSRMYVFTTGEEFKIFEISQPLSPLLRSSNFHGGDYSHFTSLVSWSNNSAALGTTLYGLWLYNTTNATAPFVSAVWNPVTGYRVHSMAKGAGSWLYVSASVSPNGTTVTDTRLETLNVSNMASPTSRFVHNLALGAGSQGAFNNLTFISSGFSGPKFLVGTRSYLDYELPVQLENSLVLYELPPGFLTSEAVPFHIANIPLPYAHGNIAYGVGGTDFFAAADEAGVYRITVPTTWAPGFGIQPRSQNACINNVATLSAFASGNPATITYQWYRNNVPLNDGPTGWGSTLSGTHDSVLVVDRVRPEEYRSPSVYQIYRCVATNSCGSTSSFSAYIVVCAPDYNCDRVVDFFDYLDFVEDFSFSQPRADFNADDVVDFFDYLDFVQAFSVGC